MLRGLFVTGTDTGVGKTVVAAALMHRYRSRTGTLPSPSGVRYWKPIQTGIEQDDDTAEVARLGMCRPDEVFAKGVRLERPVSPHLAARLAGTPIDVDALLDMVRAERPPGAWVIEGAGGALVPVRGSILMIDLMVRLAMPVLVVSRTAVGTINHTLLTLEALRARSLEVAGVLMAGPPSADNRAAIETYGAVPVVGEMPQFDRVTPEVLGRWAVGDLDASGRLEQYFS